MGITQVLPLLALLGLATAEEALPKAYETGRTYIYDYAASALTGMPKVSNQMSGFHVMGSAAITRQEEREFSLVLVAKVARIQRDMSPFDPRSCGFQSLPWDEKSSSKLKGWPGMKKKMDLPLVFKWKPCGHIVKVMPHPDDEQWSVDLKKGVLGMLSGSFKSMTKEMGDVFDVFDDENVDGMCRTAYSYSDADENGVREASKVRDLSNCTDSPTFRHSLFGSIPCTRNGRPGKINWVQSESATEYNVTTEDGKFMILDAETCSQYGVTPPGQKSQAMATFVAQSLRFKKAREATDKELSSDTDEEREQGLQLRLLAYPGKDGKSQPKVVTKILNGLKKTVANKGQNEMHDTLNMMVDNLRKLSEADLKKLWDGTKNDKKRRAHLLDILSAAGTKASMQIVMQLVRNGTLADPDSAQLLRLSVIAALGSSELMQDMIALADDVDSKAKPLTFRAAWLAAGTAIGKAYMESDNFMQIADKVAALAKRMAAKPVSVAEKGVTSEERDVLLLMAIGNTGIPELAGLIREKLAPENSLTVRLTAIKALRKMAPMMGASRTVRRLLFPIFAEPLEDIELRANAYLVLVAARPKRFHLAVMADMLRKEPSEHLLSFVSSHLRLLGRLRTPSACAAKMAGHARWLLRALPRGGYEGPSRFRSRVFYMPLSKALGLGAYGAVIYGKESTLPRSLTLGLRGVFEDNLVNFAEISIRSNETDRLLRGFLGPEGKMYSWLAGKLKMQDIMATETKQDPSKPVNDVGTSITYTLFGEDLFQYNANAMRKAQIQMGKIPAAYAAYLGVIMKGGLKELALWNRIIYLDSSNAVATSAGIAATLDIVHSSHRSGYVKVKGSGAKSWQMETNTGVSYRQMSSFGLEFGDKWTQVTSSLDIAVFPGQRAPFVWTMASDRSKLKQGKLMQMIHMARPADLPIKLFDASVQLHMCSSDSKRTKLVSAVREMKTEKMDIRFLKPLGFDLKGKITRAVKLRRVMESDLSEIMMRRDLLTQPMRMSLELANSKRAKKKQGLYLTFKMDTREAKGPHPMAKDLPRREDMNVVSLKKVMLPGTQKSKMKVASEPYLDMPAKPSGIVKEGALTLSMCELKASGKCDKAWDLGSLKLRLQGRGFYELLLSTILKSSWRLRGVAGSVGGRAIYNPQQPFSVVANAKHFHKFELKDFRNNRVLVSGTSTWTISPWWIKWWRKMLKKPKMLRSRWPDVYECLRDWEAKEKKNFYPDSVSCFRAWELFNTFDTVKVEAKSSRYMQFGIPSDEMSYISDGFEMFFSDMKVSPQKSQRQRTMTAWLSPTDRRTMRLRTTMKSWMRRLSYEKCEVDFYASPNSVYARTFDGSYYSVMAPKAGVANSHVVLAEDRRRGLFSVVMVENGAVEIRFKVMGKTCLVSVTGKTVKMPKSVACSFAAITETSDRISDAKRITVRFLQLSVVTNGESVTELSVGPFYHDSLQGLCGDLDREPEMGEFRGGTCEEPEFFEKADNLVAHFSRKGKAALPKKCDL